jgi:hypothetical protein
MSRKQRLGKKDDDELPRNASKKKAKSEQRSMSSSPESNAEGLGSVAVAVANVDKEPSGGQPLSHDAAALFREPFVNRYVEWQKSPPPTVFHPNTLACLSKYSGRHAEAVLPMLDRRNATKFRAVEILERCVVGIDVDDIDGQLLDPIEWFLCKVGTSRQPELRWLILQQIDTASKVFEALFGKIFVLIMLSSTDWNLRSAVYSSSGQGSELGWRSFVQGNHQGYCDECSKCKEAGRGAINFNRKQSLSGKSWNW